MENYAEQKSFEDVGELHKMLPERGLKKPISIRLDEDTLAWFRGHGKGYQTLITDLLTAYKKSKEVKKDAGKEPVP